MMKKYPHIVAAIISALLATVVNVTLVSYWAGQVGAHLVEQERRLSRIEGFIDRFTTFGGFKP